MKNSGCEAVVVSLSSALSGAYQSAVLAKNQLEYDECYIIDSLTASGGERILVEQAVKLRDAGKSASEIACFLETLRSRISLYACIDSVDYLYKGGRISRAACTIASVAHIKPIIHVLRDGSIDIAAKSLGIKRTMDFIKKILDKYPPDKDFPFYVLYTGNKKCGKILAEYFEKTDYEIPDANAPLEESQQTYIYDKVSQLIEQEEYYAALENLALLGDYKDSAELYDFCMRRYAAKVGMWNIAEEYLIENMDSFTQITGDTLKEIIPGNSWYLQGVGSNGWKYLEDGTIDDGWGNDRGWSVEGDLLVIRTKNNYTKVSVLELYDGGYVLLENGEYYATLYKVEND